MRNTAAGPDETRARRRGRAIAICASLLSVLSPPAFAAAPEQPSETVCTKTRSTPETAGCMEDALDKADKALNAAYRMAAASIDAADLNSGLGKPDPVYKANWKTELAAAQRAWIAFRDADCGDLVVSEWQGGTGTGIAILSCKYDKTVLRTRELTGRYPR